MFCILIHADEALTSDEAFQQLQEEEEEKKKAAEAKQKPRKALKKKKSGAPMPADEEHCQTCGAEFEVGEED